jgi:polar amino acid transport system substrate-binding protein
VATATLRITPTEKEFLMTTTSPTRFTSVSRRLVLALLAAQFALPMLGGRLHAAGLDEIKKRGLTVATEDDFRPFEFVKDGKPTGFDNELVEDLRKYAPFEIKQEILPWTGILAGVSTGKYDVAITAAIITKERKKSLDFTSPIADATHYYVKRKGDASIASIKDLSGKTVGVQAGSALLARLPELDAMLKKIGGSLGKVVEYTSYPEAYQDLALGRTDYVVNTVINLKTLAAEKPAVFEVGQAVSGPSFPAWAVAKDNTELLAFLNEFIAKEKASGRFAELQKKWFGEAFPDLPVTFEPEF